MNMMTLWQNNIYPLMPMIQLSNCNCDNDEEIEFLRFHQYNTISEGLV